MNDDQIAAALFGPAVHLEPSATGAPPDVHVRGDDVPASATDPTEALYRHEVNPATGASNVYGAAERNLVAAAVERFGLPEAEATGFARSWSPVFAEFGANATEADQIVEAGIAAAANGLDDATLDTWEATVKTDMRSAFGDLHEQALDDARRLVARHPRLRDYLESTGLGSHPKVVAVVARQARAMRVKGQL